MRLDVLGVRPLLVLMALGWLGAAVVIGQSAPAVDTSKLGPQVGSRAPSFSGSDQLGRPHTLESSLGAKGAMLVFFRSADW